MTERLRMKPFVPYSDRARFYQLLSLSLDITGLNDDSVIGNPVSNKFMDVVYMVSSVMSNALSTVEKSAPLFETLNMLKNSDKKHDTIHELFMAFSPLSPEEEVVFRTLSAETSMAVVVSSLSTLGKLISRL